MGILSTGEDRVLVVGPYRPGEIDPPKNKLKPNTKYRVRIRFEDQDNIVISAHLLDGDKCVGRARRYTFA
jgi:hypothetical protein